MVWAIGVNRPYVRPCPLDGLRAFLFFFQRYQFHPAFRTITGGIAYHFGMHPTGVFLFLVCLLLILVRVIVIRAIKVNRPGVRDETRLQRKCACDYGCNVTGTDARNRILKPFLVSRQWARSKPMACFPAG